MVAHEVDDALRTIGFLLVTGHGVDLTARDAVRNTAREFFLLPEETKSVLATPPGGRGWIPPGVEANAYSEGGESPPDLKESFAVAPELPAGTVPPAWAPPNQWPDGMSEFRSVTTTYLAQMRTLADELLEIFAVGLGLEPMFFVDRARRSPSSMNINWYPPATLVGEPEAGQFRIGPHSDFGTLTILDRQEGLGGLQVYSQDGEWIDAPYDPTAFTVNLGELMARWTGDRWRATRHRVLPPHADAPDEELLSLVYFFEIDLDTVIEPLEPPAAGPNRYEPVIAADYLQAQLDAITVG
jgi:isopenicillin N synthase-like dioxygenase